MLSRLLSFLIFINFISFISLTGTDETYSKGFCKGRNDGYDANERLYADPSSPLS